MSIFQVTDPQANEILQFSNIQNKFVNVEPSLDSLNISLPQHQIVRVSGNPTLLSKYNDNKLYTKGLKAGDNVRLNSTSTDVEISVDLNTDALTLSGYSHDDFLKKSENLSGTDPIKVREYLNVYDIAKTHNIFMETNASNIPDVDDVYELGANGRRYSDIYAYTFHGTATNAMYAENISNMGAEDGQILKWRDDQDRWVPVYPINPDDIPETTDDLPEGRNNLYFTNDRAKQSASQWFNEGVSVFDLEDISGTPSDIRDNSILVWNKSNSRYESRTLNELDAYNNIYDVFAHIPYEPGVNEIIYNFSCPQDFFIKSGADPSYAYIPSPMNKTPSPILYIKKNGATIGRFVFTPGSYYANVDFPLDVKFEKGDILSVRGPNRVDNGLKNIGVLIRLNFRE